MRKIIKNKLLKKRTNKFSKLDAAKLYAELGYQVLPLYPVVDGKCSCHNGKDCKQAGKHPMTAHGHKDGTTSIKIIKKWWEKYPKANIGIATGSGSNLVVVDIDPRNGGNETFAKLERELGPLPITAIVLTGGGGRHIYLSHSGISTKLPSRLGNGIDLLGNGKIAVAAGSIHKSGKRYEFADGKTFAEAPPVPLPDDWLEFCVNHVKSPALKSGYVPSAQDARDLLLMSRAGSQYNAGDSIEIVKKAMHELNSLSNSPPLADSKVDAIVDNLFADFNSRKSILDNNDPAYAISELMLKEKYNSGRHLLFASNGYFYIYNSKFWIKTGDDIIKKDLLEIIVRELNSEGGSKQSFNALINNSLSLLKSTCADVHGAITSQEEPRPVINCQNGELWLDPLNGTWELMAHSPSSYQQYCLPFNYSPDAKCPTYDKALLAIFRDTKAPKAMSRHFNELFGYIIQPKRDIPLIVICIGEGENGKTILMTTIKKLMGGDAVYECANIIDLPNNRFAIGELFGKLLLIDDDVKQGVKLPDGFLKKISERKSLTGEAKFKPSFQFISLALPVLLSNHVPSISDLSTGMRRRLMVIPFNRTFTDAEKDDSVFQTIWANEMSGVLNRALEGLSRLFERKHFKLPKPVQRASQDLIKDANPLVSFIHETCKRDVNGKIPLDELYKNYSRWADDSGITIVLQKNTMKKNLELMGYKIKHTNKGNVLFGLTYN